MKKIQKVWLGIFLAIALVPEILFQSTIRLVHGVITIKGITFGHNYVLVLAQSVSLLISAVLVFVWRRRFKSKIVYYLLFGFLLLWALVAYIVYDLALNGQVTMRDF